jgi:hypothetical protein
MYVYSISNYEKNQEKIPPRGETESKQKLKRTIGYLPSLHYA